MLLEMRGLIWQRGSVMFMDSDDYVSPDILAFTLDQVATCHGSIVIVGHI